MKISSWHKKSFANKIIAQTLLISIISILFLSGGSLFLSYQSVDSGEQSLRTKDLIIARNSLETTLNLILVQLIDLTQDPEIINGISQGVDSEIYIEPVFRTARFQALLPYNLVLWNREGKKVFSNQEILPAPINNLVRLSAVDATSSVQTQSGQSNEIRIGIEQNDGSDSLVLSANLVQQALNRSIGSVRLEIPMLDLLAHSIASQGDPREWVLSNSKHALDAELIPLRLNPPLDQLHLTLRLKDPGQSAIKILKILVPSFAILAFLGLCLSWFLSSWMGASLAAPIISLASSARSVVQFGRVDPALITSLRQQTTFEAQDEMGQLLRDELAMLTTLAHLQNDLEAQVLQRSATLNTIFELSPDGYLEVLSSEKIGFVNPAFISMMGFAELNFSDLTWQKMRGLLNERLVAGEQQFNDNFFVQRVLRFNTPSVKTFLVSMRITSFGNRIFYWRDLTNEFEMEALKTAFFAKITHELRTPLSSILGFSHLLRNAPETTPAQKEYADIIIRQSNNVLSLINNFLEIAKIESNQVKQMDFSRHSLAALTRLILSDFKFSDDDRQVHAFLEDHLPEIAVNRQLFRQVLVNLLSNAYKYSPRGSPIEVRTCDELQSGKRWIGIEIRDHGIGMTSVQLSQLGTPFYRANPDGKEIGTGLGISVVRSIMAQHGGRVDFSSAPDKGTTAVAWFPSASPIA